MLLYNCKFISNYGEYGGALIFEDFKNGSLSINNTNFTSNAALLYGDMYLISK